MEDIVRVIAQTRPSVSAGDLARFERFGQAGA
jgi:hypothetical protein